MEEIIINGLSLKEIADAALEFLRIRSLAQFADWFNRLSTGAKIVYSIGLFGAVVLMYIFIVSIFTDKY